MPKEYDDTNRGAAFRNSEKGPEGTEKWADFKGSINIEGEEYWLDCWKKLIQNGDRAGETMLSFSVKPKDQKPQRGQRPQRRQQPQEDW